MTNMGSTIISIFPFSIRMSIGRPPQSGVKVGCPLYPPPLLKYIKANLIKCQKSNYITYYLKKNAREYYIYLHYDYWFCILINPQCHRRGINASRISLGVIDEANPLMQLLITKSPIEFMVSKLRC